MSKTYFIDIDGTILRHRGSLTSILLDFGEVLPNVIQKLNDWAIRGDRIIITTARPESMRQHTINELEYNGIFYDQLIMGLNHGPRVVINDAKSEYEEMAIGITVDRNKGLGDVR